jgi:hypothetical protein
VTAPHEDDRVDSDLPADLAPWLQQLQATTEPVPELDLELATAALTTRDLDAELIELWDSREHAPPRPGDDADLAQPLLRGTEDEWALSLSVDASDVVVTVVRRDGLRRIVGAVTGDVPETRLEWLGGSAQVRPDEIGRFEVEVPSGPLRLRLSWPGRVVVSSWVTV